MPDKNFTGKAVRVFIDDGAGTKLEVEHQADLSYSTGRSLEQTRTKNSVLPYLNESGATATFSMVRERPSSAGQTRLRAVAATNEDVDVEIKEAMSGGLIISGTAKIAISEMSFPTEGLAEDSVTIAFVNDPIEGVVP